MFGAKKIVGLVLVDSSVGEPPVPPSIVPFTNGLRKDRDIALTEFVRAILPRSSNAEIESLIRGAKRMSLDDSIALLSYPFEREHWKQIAHAFTKPLLYVVTPQFAAQARNLKANRPATRVEIFERAGHALFVDEAPRFNALIANFAESIAGR
jgi:microsomal epoxide hydrolase